MPRLTRGCTLCGVAMIIRLRAQLPPSSSRPSCGPAAHAPSPTTADRIIDVPQGDEYSDTNPSALTDFRPALDPYGTSVDNPSYGTAWTPDPDQVGADFEPYDSAGQWGYVGNDYTWMSDYAWGPVCFHYGRWVFAAGRWLWIPGRLYSGAWVDWRVGDDGMLGWAPVAPAYGWYGGSAFGFGFQSPEPWAFAPFGDVFGAGLSGRITFGSASAGELAAPAPTSAASPGRPTPSSPRPSPTVPRRPRWVSTFRISRASCSVPASSAPASSPAPLPPSPWGPAHRCPTWSAAGPRCSATRPRRRAAVAAARAAGAERVLARWLPRGQRPGRHPFGVRRVRPVDLLMKYHVIAGAASRSGFAWCSPGCYHLW